MQNPPQPPSSSYGSPPPFHFPPQPPPKRNIWQRFRALPLIIQIPIALFLVVFVGSAALSGAHDALFPVTPTPEPVQSAQSVQPKPTQVTQVHPTATPKPQPTQAPVAITATHGTPYLGGPIGDFLGKYGQPFNGTDPGHTGWRLNDQADILLVHYDTATKKVNYISYTGPDSWSKAKYRDYLLTFAPSDYSEDTAGNAAWVNGGGDPYDPIAYTSPTVGRFFLHISDGSGYMNTI